MKQEIDKRNGVWVTPPDFFAPLQAEFDLKVDAAASADNAMLPDFFDAENRNAFDQDWSGLRIWCNPPYGRKEIYRWVERCATGGGFNRCGSAASANGYPLVSRFYLPEAGCGNSFCKTSHQVLRHNWRGEVSVNGCDF